MDDSRIENPRIETLVEMVERIMTETKKRLDKGGK